MKQYLLVVECAIEYQGKFLIIKRPAGLHAGGFLAFPGGKVEEIDEKNEYDMLRLAAKREVFEEVGLTLKDHLEYVVSNYFVDNFGRHVIDTVFYCKIEKTQVEVKASNHEVAEYYWMTRDEIDQAEHCSPWMKKYFEYIDLKKAV